MRRPDDKRREQREQRKERKERERRVKEAELRRLKNLKRQEVGNMWWLRGREERRGVKRDGIECVHSVSLLTSMIVTNACI